jgi:hypothetical protein
MIISLKTTIKLFLSCLLITFGNLSSGHAIAVLSPPPVEKVKPNKKKKRKAKRSGNTKKQLRLKKKNSFDSFNVGAAINTILFFILFLTGLFLFSFGATLLFWIIGLSLIVAAYIYALVLCYYYDVLRYLLAIFLCLVVGNLIIGLTFLIYGLIIANPLFWIVGIIMILLFFALWMVSIGISYRKGGLI